MSVLSISQAETLAGSNSEGLGCATPDNMTDKAAALLKVKGRWFATTINKQGYKRVSNLGS